MPDEETKLTRNAVFPAVLRTGEAQVTLLSNFTLRQGLSRTRQRSRSSVESVLFPLATEKPSQAELLDLLARGMLGFLLRQHQ
jgi:hypothetical protein